LRNLTPSTNCRRMKENERENGDYKEELKK
jgi:hypothetical protein